MPKKSDRKDRGGDGDNRRKKEKKKKGKEKKQKKQKKVREDDGRIRTAQELLDAKSNKGRKINLWKEEEMAPLVAQYDAQQAGTWTGEHESFRQMEKRTGIPHSTIRYICM